METALLHLQQSRHLRLPVDRRDGAATEGSPSKQCIAGRLCLGRQSDLICWIRLGAYLDLSRVWTQPTRQRADGPAYLNQEGVLGGASTLATRSRFALMRAEGGRSTGRRSSAPPRTSPTGSLGYEAPTQ